MWSIIGNGLKQVLLKMADLCGQPIVVKKYKVLNSLACQLRPNKEDEQIDRGYYHGPAYPPFALGFDPLLLLAGLAFLALLLQTFHSFFYRTHMHAGLPTSTLPRSGHDHLAHLADFVTSALHKYEKLSIQRAPRELKNNDSPSLISMLLPTIEKFITKSKTGDS